MKLSLYRGITLQENDVVTVIDDIKSNGLKRDARFYNQPFVDRREELPNLLLKHDLNVSDTREATKEIEIEDSICFADRLGANHYACRDTGGVKTIPVVISVEVDIKYVQIDGRDFLYTVFQNIAREQDIDKVKRIISTLSKLYGEGIALYIQKVFDHPESQEVAICDLATMDSEVIMAHLKNKVTIKGRYNTIFRSAFFVKTPIGPKSIKHISINEFYSTETVSSVSLDNILERKAFPKQLDMS